MNLLQSENTDNEGLTLQALVDKLRAFLDAGHGSMRVYLNDFGYARRAVIDGTEVVIDSFDD